MNTRRAILTVAVLILGSVGSCVTMQFDTWTYVYVLAPVSWL